MKRNNPQIGIFLIVIILLVVALGIFLLSAKANELSSKIVAKNKHQVTEQLIADINDYDYVIYYIGTIPEELYGIENHLIPIGPNAITEENMPIYWNDQEYIVYDENGDVKEHFIPRDYPTYMFVVVDSTYELSDEDLEVIRNCGVLNNVPLMFIGDLAASSFRDKLILIPKDYGNNGTMFFSNTNAVDGPVLGDGETQYTSRELTDAILSFVTENIIVEEPLEETANGN